MTFSVLEIQLLRRRVEKVFPVDTVDVSLIVFLECTITPLLVACLLHIDPCGLYCSRLNLWIDPHHARTTPMCTHAHARTHTHTHTRMRTHTRTHAHTHTHTHTHTPGMFACFGFLSLYLSGKLQCFRPAGRGQAWRLCAAVVVPLLAACVVGISRIQDHKHHWEGNGFTSEREILRIAKSEICNLRLVVILHRCSCWRRNR